MLDRLDAAAVHRWCLVGLAALRRHQHEIDELNVYPVPDGDTGTNLVLTMAAAAEALDARPTGSGGPTGWGGVDGLGRALRVLARASLLGARGNSGVIVSQLFKGLADELGPAAVADGRALAKALSHAATTAYDAVEDPVEGTILSVARAAATGAGSTGSDHLGPVVRAAADAARIALAQTPRQLPALARAGVVDAGGRGLVVLLDALVEVVTGQPTPTGAAPPDASGEAVKAAATAVRESGPAEYAYEVQYLLDAYPDAVDSLRRSLHGLGDSLVVVGTGDGADGRAPAWNVHVHVNDVGAAIEAGIRAGRPYRISVTRFADQVPVGAAVAVSTPDVAVSTPDVAVVAVVDGGGLAELFAAEGAVVVTRGPGGEAPSMGQILHAIRASGAARVVVLPNDSDLVAAANAAAGQARAEQIQTGVVHTRSPVQGLAALAVRDPQRRFDDDVIAMAEAAAACRYAEVTTASREALTMAGRCQPGDVLALVEGEVNLIGDDVVETCRQLVDRLLVAGGEMITLLVGAPAPDGLADAVVAHLARNWPFVEVQCYLGGQALYPLVVGVE